VIQAEHVLRKIHHCTFRVWELQSFWQNFLITFLHKNFYLSSQISEWPYQSFAPNFLYNYIKLLISATGQTIITAKQPSSLHISIHHSTFCASLHVKTSPAWRDSIVTKNSGGDSRSLEQSSDEIQTIKQCKPWRGMIVGHGGSFVDSTPFVWKVVSFNPVGTLGKSYTRSCLWGFGVKLRHIRVGLLCPERHWVIIGL